jgi:gamma-glutamyltranspeptidase/glutathione hydrolase
VVDVAIVAALAATCTEPGVCGPGGGGYLTIDVPGSDAVVVDGYMSHPGKGFTGDPVLREVRMPYGGGVTTLVGPGSVGVPGAFAAFETAWEMFGSLPWSVLMEIVADSVVEGFPLSPACHLYLTQGADLIFRSDPLVAEALFEGEQCRPVGSTIVFPGLAETLREIGAEGAATLYEGDLGHAIVEDLAAQGGQLTREDMSSYRAIVRQPLVSDLSGWHLSLNPEPAVGGVTVAAALDAIGDHSPAAIGRALTSAFRARYDGALRSPSTIAVAAVDDRGGAVAASFSAAYGSGLAPAGMLMNNSVGELELVSETPFPGQRMLSNMAPTVARHGTEAVAVASPGADRITTAIATTLARLVSGDGLEKSIDHPRIHPEFGDHGLRLAVEPGLDLEDLGLPLRHFEGPHMFFGGVNGAGFLAGELHVYADRRRTGSVTYTGPGS